MTTYFGSDIHLGHNNILKFCNRPFDNLVDMLHSFIGEVYSIAKKEDDVYLLGDICFNKAVESLNLLLDCPANFHLIIGNHDNKAAINHKLWKSTNYLKEIKISETDLPITLCHYPIEDWNKKRYGSLHFHGHTHNNVSHQISNISSRYDVGYDATGRWLSTKDEIITNSYLPRITQ